MSKVVIKLYHKQAEMTKLQKLCHWMISRLSWPHQAGSDKMTKLVFTLSLAYACYQSPQLVASRATSVR
jgi:hypothetical protein